MNHVPHDHITYAYVDFGHDKSRAIKPYAALPAGGRPILVYCGDGVSDISAARETDLLFAKKGRDLVLHCLKENVPFYPFDVYPVSQLIPVDFCGD
jgi:2-hydroxy-3-keto-5-methylthiopentenyl-1-phosphate phosphatase